MARRKGKKGKAAKRAKQALGNAEPEEVTKAPHSFVIYRGKLGRCASELMFDFRKVMEPYTATNLKVQKRNSVKDFLSIAGPLNVTHMVVFTKTEIAMYMKVIRLPRGPTLTFRIHGYTLTRDVLSSLKKKVTYAAQFLNHPLIIMNNFSGDGMHIKLMTSMFQNMFPAINVNKVKLNSIRRCVLLNYNQDTKHIEFRHYTIKVVPCGVSKTVKKLVQGKVPDLGKYNDFSEYIMKPGNLSESEAELDGPHNEVTLPQKISARGAVVAQQSSIRLVELGPRLTLQLVKIEEGFMTGEILYHEYIQKTPEEIAALKARRERLGKLKQQRKKQQEENVKKKQKLKEKTNTGAKKQENLEENQVDSNESEDDAEWYRKEVGEEPDKDLFSSKKPKVQVCRLSAKKRKMMEMQGPNKKARTEKGKVNAKKPGKQYVVQKNVNLKKKKKKSALEGKSTNQQESPTASNKAKKKQKPSFRKKGNDKGQENSTVAKKKKAHWLKGKKNKVKAKPKGQQG